MNYIKSLILKQGLTGPKLADLVGCSNVEIWRLTKYPDKGGRKMNLEWAERLAPHLKVSVQELLFPNSASSDDTMPDVNYATVLGEVGPNRFFQEDVVDEDYRYIAKFPGQYSLPDQYAFKILSNSMDKKEIRKGDYVICVDYFKVDRDGLTDGDIVIAEIYQGNFRQRICAELSLFDKGFELRPHSSDPRWSAFVVKDSINNILDDGSVVYIKYLVIGKLSQIKHRKR